VTLDGTDSTDPDGSIVRFEWFEDLGLPTERFLGEGDTISSPGPIFAGITRRSSRSTRV
jgi:YD repeat-containing protein